MTRGGEGKPEKKKQERRAASEKEARCGAPSTCRLSKSGIRRWGPGGARERRGAKWSRDTDGSEGTALPRRRRRPPCVRLFISGGPGDSDRRRAGGVERAARGGASLSLSLDREREREREREGHVSAAASAVCNRVHRVQVLVSDAAAAHLTTAVNVALDSAPAAAAHVGVRGLVGVGISLYLGVGS